MNQFIYKSFISLLLSASLIVLTGCNSDGLVYQVNDVVADPGAYAGDLTLEGVVYTFSRQNQSIVGVMDIKELQCTTPNCKKTLLAVQVPGSKLSIGDEVTVSGSLVKQSWGYLLTAKDVQVIANHKLGG